MRIGGVSIGETYGRLTVVAYNGVNQHQKTRWLCRCSCGNERTVVGGSLRSGNTTSCGCVHLESLRSRRSALKAKYRKEYDAWKAIHQRCGNPNNPSYRDYGARGVRVAAAWNGAAGFVSFLTDVGIAPTAQHSIDRIDGTKGYEPGNCRWATPATQSANRRSVRQYAHDGQSLTLIEWARALNMSYTTLDYRLRVGGLSFAQATVEPCGPFREVRRGKVYTAWLQIKQRCHNPRHHQYANYGGRGILVCDTWRTSFDAFYAEVGDPPTPQHSLDRRNNEKGYEPGNCRWATSHEQAQNRRSSTRSAA